MERNEQKSRSPQWAEAVSYGWLGERTGKVTLGFLAMRGMVLFIEEDSLHGGGGENEFSVGPDDQSLVSLGSYFGSLNVRRLPRRL